MMDWLTDTFIWTAALIALVLLIRRPVARHFGPQAAYALWALPLIRLVLPPLTLPAWMAPAEPTPGLAAEVAPLDVFALVAERNSVPVPAADVTLSQPMLPFTLTEFVLAIWLVGAATFLFLRFRAYSRMRQELLAEGRDVGQTGKVRLIETPSTSAPLAFGVVDKVVALPEGFMATWDRDARDLALAHELAHHRGNDLAINMAVQPLFALHWFNPLGHLGWLALRRDQEAACDARVIAERASEDRATYAQVIASFAAGPNVALAAPMACPVLGDKSIIHRLRSLKMNNQSTKRRMAGRGLVAAALVALPLTATITYADSTSFDEVFADVPAPPAPPTLGSVAPTPPTPPAPAALVQVAPEAPEAPVVEENVWVERDEDGVERRYVVRTEVHGDGEHELHREVKKHRIVRVESDGEGLSEEEKREIIMEVRESLDEADGAIKEAMAAQRGALAQFRDNEGNFTVVEVNCESG
ncbi:MAG: M56 family metallopeptidase, partial [Altererythrobacter sp.]|nr:M56 family metallopeptidase [Altererythrobacter sp.]